MLKNKIYFIFILTLLCFFLISISAAGISTNYKIDGHTVKNKMHPKIESGLLEEKHAPGKQSTFISQIQNQNSIKVVFEVNNSDKGYIESLENNGATIEAMHENLVQASVPVSQVQGMSELPFVNYVRSPRAPLKDAISSEGVAVINSTPLNNLGIRGQGVKIAIIDVGFAGYKKKLGTELPSSVITKDMGYPEEDINNSAEAHGTAVAEIIYDIAPDAQLYLIKIESDVEFLKAVDYAMDEEVDIISMSMGWLDVGPFDGTSNVSQKVNSAVSGGVVWVNSAGNYAQKHWKGKFNDTDGNGINNFTAENENMDIDLPSAGYISIFLSWDDWPTSDQDYDLYIYNSAGSEVASSKNLQDGGQRPIESIISIYLEKDIYNLQIRKDTPTSKDVNFELFSAYQDLESQYRVPSSSLSIPADAQGAITVGATNYLNDVLESLSSQGPTIDGRIKPDLVAPDGVSTSTYLPFTGTSASAPHVAGAAALLKSINSSLTPSDVRSALENTAKDLGNKGKDNLYGSGRIDAWKAAISVDKESPTITITSPSNGQNLNASVITVTGTSSDNVGVSKVEVKVGAGSWQTAQGTISWSASVTLSEGQNTISARAIDVLENMQNTSVTVNALSAQGKTAIISWTNNKTNDDSTTLTINTSEIVRFNATANQTITTWNWFKDGVIQDNNFDDFTASWSTAGTKIVKVNATNSNGTTDTITWTVTVNTLTSQDRPAIISWINNKTNDSSQSLTINTSENVKFNATANQTITTWNWFKDGINQNNNLDNLIASWPTAGTKTVKVNATNSNGTSNTITWTVTVNELSPLIITITSPDDSENSNGNVRITANLNREGTAFLNWNGVNESMDGTGISFFRNKTGLLSGVHRFRVYANGGIGNISSVSETRIITVNRSTSSQLGINTSTFIVNSTGIITSPGGNVTVTVPNGTNASVNGSYLPSISIDSLAEMNSTFMAKLGSGDRLIGENLSLGPAGAIFKPDIQIRFNYTDQQLAAAGVGESDLSVKYYNTTIDSWEPLAIYERNTSGNYLIVNASHFSTFALIGVQTKTTVPSSNSGGGSSGGGGGGGGASGENYTNIVIKEKYDLSIYKDKLTSYAFTHKLNPILYINVTGNVNAGEINAAIEVLKNTSSLLKSPAPGKVYQNMNIWLGTSGFATAKNIKEAVIRFRVDNAWIDSNSLDANDINMVRWDGTKWTQLETRVVDKDGTNTYFETSTDGFSHFAIIGLKEVQSAAEINGTYRWNILRPEPTGTTRGIVFGVAPSINLVIIIGIFIVVLIVAVLYLKKNRYIKR